MAAQVEVDAGRPCVVGSRLHLSPLIDSSNKSLMESSGGTQGSLIFHPEPNKPAPGPKPRLTPKPFTVEKNPTIRPILAPKPQPKPKPEPSRPVSSKPDLPSTPKPQLASKPSVPPAFKTGPKPSGQTNKPVAFKPAPTIASTDSSKFRTTQTGDVLRRTSFGASPARPKTDFQTSTPGAEWPFASPKKQPGPSITRAKSVGFLSEIGLNNEDSKEDSGAKDACSSTVLRPQSKGSRPRPVSAAFLQSPTMSESQVVSPTPAPRWTKGRPLSSDLTSKFETIGLSLNRRPTKEDGKENTPQMLEGVGAKTQEKEHSAERAEGSKKSPLLEKRTQKIESKDENSKKDFKPEDTGGSSIKRRISLLLDSSSSPFSVARVDTPGTEPRSLGLSVSDTDGALGVKQRIKELTEEVPTTLSPPQKPQCKPRTLVSDRTKRFEAALESHSSYELKGPQQVEEDQNKKFDYSMIEGQFTKQEDRKASSLGVQDLSTNSGFDSDRVQTVRASMFEHVVERHNVQVMEDNISQDPRAQQESTIKPMPRRNHYLRIQDKTLKALEDDEPGSLVKATYREQVSPSSPVRVEHVFDTVALFGENRAVSEVLPTASLEDRAHTLRSRRSAPQGKEDRPTYEIGNLLKDEAATPRYLRVGALQKWTATEADREIESQMEQQKEMLRKLEEEIQRQTELHMAAAAVLQEEEEDSEVERKKQLEAQRVREREREEVAAPKRPKILEAEEQMNKPRATYFALTGQIQEPVHQGERVEEEAILGNIKRGMKEVLFDDFTVRSGQWGLQNPIAPFRRNPSLEAAMQRDSQEEPHKNDTCPRTDHRLQERERQKAFREETEIETQRLAEFEKVMELERQQEIKKQRDLEIEKQKIEREKKREIEIQKEKERQKELERQREQEREKQRELERQREIEQQKREKERQKQIEYERMKAAERELEQQREFERQRQKEFELEKERMLDQERLRLREFEKWKEMERERKRQLELDRQREIERQKQRELEKHREMERLKELERQRELERQQELEKQKEQERERQRQLERQRELDRQRELERQEELERQLEIERQWETERQKELERRKQRELEIEKWKRQKAEERETKKELAELERIKELERQQLLDFELQRQREKQLQQEQAKQRSKKEREDRQKMSEWQRASERHRMETEQEKFIPTSPLRPKVLDLDAVSLGFRTGRDSHENSPTARWKQPSLHPNELYKPGILDIDSFRSQTQPDTFSSTGYGGLESGSVGSVIQARPQATQPNVLQPQTASQVQSPLQSQFHPQSQAFFQPSPAERMRTQLPPPLQPQILHQTQPHSLPFATERPRPQTNSLIETSDWPFVAQQPNNDWVHTKAELAVDEPLWVSAMEGSRRPVSTRPVGLEQQLLHHEDRGSVNILTDSSASSMSPVFTPVLHPNIAPPMVPIQTPMLTAQPGFGPIQTPMLTAQLGLGPIQTPMLTAQPGPGPIQTPMLSTQPGLGTIQTPVLTAQPCLHPSVAPIMTPERCWTSEPLNVGSNGALVPPPTKPLAKKETSVPTSQVATFSVTDPIWSPNWELASQGQRENRASHRDKVQQKRSRSMCRRSAPTESSADGPLTHMRTRRSRSAHKERSGETSELVKQYGRGPEENKDTDNLVQETDSQYGTWETGLRTDDSLTPATPSSDDNLTPSPRKPTPPHTAGQPHLFDTPDGLTTSPQKQTELPFPETPTTLLDSSALRARVSLNKKSTRRAPPSRANRHSALLSQVPEGTGADDEWRYKDSTEEKTGSSKQGEESDSEEQAKGIESRTSSMSQPQRVALFPGMDPSALKNQLKKRGESDNQTDGPSPSQLSRSPKSPFLPRAARVLPPAGGKENGEESSPQWLKELKTKKRLSQYENDSTA
uniref:Si:ch73-138n13.1 n=1 Tax=Cyprinus carpio carpio TaxID=630221 RepID=A0A9J7XE45_CYPCA